MFLSMPRDRGSAADHSPRGAAMTTILEYLRFYRSYAADKWDHLTPMQYGTILISVGVLGWLLMKSAPKR
jgi:hypothetical protein